MCAGNGNGLSVVIHDLAEQFRSRKHRDTGFLCGRKFRVILFDGCGIDNEICARQDVFGTLSVEDPGTHRGKVIGEFGLF